ncbi:MAG: alpha/beta fold hydrolase [Opitutaceae bacterium]|jgi:dienelactone hydrolase
MKIRLLFGLGFAFLGSFSEAQVPLPNDLAIASSSPGAPAQIAAFLGAWGGDAWQGLLPHVLVVEQVNSTGTANVVYAIGDAPEAKIKARWTRVVGQFSDGRLHLNFPNGAGVDYLMKDDGTLFGRYVIGGVPSYVRLTRFPTFDARAIVAKAAEQTSQLWSEIRIPEKSSVGETTGEAIMLQAMLYRASFPGRRPLIIINHGSTGGGEISAAAMPRYLDGAMPRVFLSLGYDVVAPLRKGFGKTVAPMIEEPPSRSPQEVQLDSAVEDLDATIEFMRAQPYVDSSRILVSGQSRGGFLAIVYAARHPDKVAGVINFSGGWWGEHAPFTSFNVIQFGQAGRKARVPMLWLYADHDPYYSLRYVEDGFAEFRAQGGNGELVEFHDISGNGHFLSAWPDRWEVAVANYLKRIR